MRTGMPMRMMLKSADLSGGEGDLLREKGRPDEGQEEPDEEDEDLDDDDDGDDGKEQNALEDVPLEDLLADLGALQIDGIAADRAARLFLEGPA
jgi:hypothetical protein